MLAALLATYAAVFLAEIVGDKLLYTTGILATRYRPLPIMIAVASMLLWSAIIFAGRWIAYYA